MSELVVALDLPGQSEALAMAARLKGIAPWMKVGQELFTAAGPPVVRELKNMGFKVFLDLKFHDIPNTVRGGVRSAAATGADMTNIHICGGETMCRTATEEAGRVREEGGNMLLLGVTVLTSSGKPELPGFGSEALVLQYAQEASDWGLDGVVCSALEAPAIKKIARPGFICLTPGIRPAEAATYDQKRITTPDQAVRAGSDFLVVGRPITRSEDPAGAARAILSEMDKAK